MSYNPYNSEARNRRNDREADDFVSSEGNEEWRARHEKAAAFKPGYMSLNNAIAFIRAMDELHGVPNVHGGEEPWYCKRSKRD